MRLRSRLFLLALATLLPVVVFAVFVSSLLVQKERDTFRRGAMDRARAMMTAADAELRGSIASLQALAASQTLEKDDLRAFHAEAVRVLASQPNWHNVVLSSVAGIQLVNALKPYGTELPAPPDVQSVKRTAQTLRPAVGGIAPGPGIQGLGVPVRVPIVRAAAAAYVLTAVVKAESFRMLLEQQNLPGGWISGLVDADQRFVARIPDLPVGQSVSDHFRAALRGAQEGWYRGLTIEGRDTYTAFVRSRFSDWSIGVAIPAAVVGAAGTRTAWTMGIGALASIALAFGFALLMGRGISRPIVSLAEAARSIGRGIAVKVPDPGSVREVAEMAAALNEAGTAVREREQRQRRAEGELREANRSKDEFLATLSHELRNPLAAIVTASHVLRQGQGRPAIIAQCSDILERQSAQMTRLIEDLLDISRITMGKISLSQDAIDLGLTISRLMEGWQSAGRFDLHRIQSRIDPAWVRGDAGRVEQIVSNLLDNSLKFTPPGGEIAVRVTREAAEAVIEIEDSGTGMSSELAERAFDLFVQGEQTLERASGGLGIGLALVKRLVELHGGTVSVRSPGAGRGATFTVRLPAVAAGAAAQAGRVPASTPASVRRILLVEDNEDARHMQRLALEQLGHIVYEAADGPASLEAAATHRPEVAIVDVGLPGMDGYEVARRLREDTRHPIVLIALTGYGQPEDQRRALEAGFDAHVTKPVRPERLEQIISSVQAGR